MRLTIATIITSLLIASPSIAQSTAVGASVFAEVARSGSFEAQALGRENTRQSLNGESFGGALRIARALGERWGVELEAGLPGAVENETTSERFSESFIQGPGLVPTPIRIGTSSRTSTRRTQTTVGAALWIRQPLGERVTLVYLGGVSFGRLRYESEQETTFSGLPISLFSPPPTINRIETVSYGVGPVIGLEAQISLTERLAAVPGIKFHSLAGWLVRPGVGVQWTF